MNNGITFVYFFKDDIWLYHGEEIESRYEREADTLIRIMSLGFWARDTGGQNESSVTGDSGQIREL